MINFLHLKNPIFLILIFITISSTFLNKANSQDAKQEFKDLLKEETEGFKLLGQEFIDNKSAEYFLKSTYKYEKNGNEIEIPVLMEYPDKSNLKEAGVSEPASIHDIYYGLNAEALEGNLNVNELNGLRYKIEELAKKEYFLKWQIQYGDIIKDLPVLSQFPLALENFNVEDISIYQGLSSRSLSNTVNYYSPELDKSVEVKIDHGLKARLNFDDCDKSSSFSVNGNDFIVEKNTSRRNNTNLILKYYQNEILVTVRSDAEKSRDVEAELEELKPLLEELDMEAMKEFEFPSVQQAFEHVPSVPLDKDVFRDVITITNEEFKLDKVTTREDKMIVTYHILTKEEQPNFKIHLAYGDFGKEIQGGRMQLYGIKRFTVYEEFECSQADTKRGGNLNMINNTFSFDKEKISRWEKENIDFSKVNSLADKAPVQVGDFKLVKFNPDMNDPEAKIAYKNNKGEEINMAFTYGDDAIKEYLQFQLVTFNKNEEVQSGQLSVNNFNYNYMVKGDDLIAYIFKDNLLIGFYIDSDGKSIKKSKATLKSFLKEFEIEEILNWERPKDYEITIPSKTKDGVEICLDTECMEEKLSNCSPAAFGGPLNRRLSVIYQIEESEGDQCKLSMVYDRNPNEDWEGKPLYFSIPKNGNFDQEVIQKVSDCLEGKSNDCSGPLLDEIEN
ncbi:MAG: hypothetical protein ACQETL_01270 [Bacteroidota bacterium]